MNTNQITVLHSPHRAVPLAKLGMMKVHHNQFANGIAREVVCELHRQGVINEKYICYAYYR